MLKKTAVGNLVAVFAVSLLIVVCASSRVSAQNGDWVTPTVVTSEQLQREDPVGNAGRHLKTNTFPSKDESRFNQRLEKFSPIVQIGLPENAIRKNAPNRYVVKSNDSTWRVANLFLIDPWLWPSLRGNPYPRVISGQTLIMKRDKGLVRVIAVAAPSSRGSAKKRVTKPAKKRVVAAPLSTNRFEKDLSVEVLSPRVIEMELDAQPQYRSILRGSIDSFLPKKNIIPLSEMELCASIDKPLDNKYVAVAGDYIYLNDFNGSVGDVLDVYSRGLELTPEDQDPKFEPAVYQELSRVGKLRVEKVNPSGNGRALALITQADEEIFSGLVVMPPRAAVVPGVFEPKRPERMIKPTVLTISNGLGGLRGSSLLLNKGGSDGVEIGHVFSVIKSRLGDGSEVELWDANVEGFIMVVEVYERYSYAIVLASPSLIKPGTNLVPAQEK